MSFLLSQAALIGAAESGLIYCFVALGIFISFKILDFPDLTVEGSFPLGAAVVTTLLLLDMNPWLATLLAAISGAICGSITAFLSQVIKIPKLLASIITGTSLYSINLHILGGANLPLMNKTTIFDTLNAVFPNPLYNKTIILLILALITIFLLWRYFESNNGLAMRATGLNIKMSQAQSINTNFQIFIGMSISNALVALGGALYSQVNYYADSSLGVGTIILGLSAVIIGATFVSEKRIIFSLIGCLFGAVIYWILIAYALNGIPGMTPFDLNLITALMISIILIFAKKFKKQDANRL